MAIGSLNEIATQLEVAFRIGYLDLPRFSEAEALVDECLAITFGLRKRIR